MPGDPGAAAATDDGAAPAGVNGAPRGAPSGQEADEAELEQLEALADEITAEAAEEAAGGSPSAEQLVHQCWEAAFDHNSQRYYYFNRATGQSQWHLPLDWVPESSRPAASPAAARASSGRRASGPGYWYKDATGVEQGPFTKEQLLQWRGLLPMDLALWHASGAGPPTAEERQQTIELARVLDDGELLARWQEEYPHQVGGAAWGLAGIGIGMPAATTTHVSTQQPACLGVEQGGRVKRWGCLVWHPRNHSGMIQLW